MTYTLKPHINGKASGGMSTGAPSKGSPGLSPPASASARYKVNGHTAETLKNVTTPPTTYSRSQSVRNSSKFVKVVLADKNTVDVKIEPKQTVEHIYNFICGRLNLRDSDVQIFGLAQLIDNQYHFLEKKVKIQKLLPKGWIRSFKSQTFDTGASPLTLYFKVQYYVDNIKLLRDRKSREIYYQQLHDNLLNYNQLCRDEQCFLLASYGLQARFGPFNPRQHVDSYFDPREFFPPWMLNKFSNHYLIENMPRTHQDLGEMTRFDAQMSFIKEVSTPPTAHNLHFYQLKKRKHEGDPEFWIAICPNGIEIHRQCSDGFKRLLSKHQWSEISNISYKNKKFILDIVTEEVDRRVHRKTQNTFHTDSERYARSLLLLCRDTHVFYRSIQDRLEELKLMEEADRRSHCRDREIGNGFVDHRTYRLSSTSTNTSGIVNSSFEDSDHDRYSEIMILSPPVAKPDKRLTPNKALPYHLFTHYIPSPTTKDSTHHSTPTNNNNVSGSSASSSLCTYMCQGFDASRQSSTRSQQSQKSTSFALPHFVSHSPSDSLRSKSQTPDPAVNMTSPMASPLPAPMTRVVTPQPVSKVVRSRTVSTTVSPVSIVSGIATSGVASTPPAQLCTDITSQESGNEVEYVNTSQILNRVIPKATTDHDVSLNEQVHVHKLTPLSAQNIQLQFQHEEQLRKLHEKQEIENALMLQKQQKLQMQIIKQQEAQLLIQKQQDAQAKLQQQQEAQLLIQKQQDAQAKFQQQQEAQLLIQKQQDAQAKFQQQQEAQLLIQKQNDAQAQLQQQQEAQLVIQKQKDAQTKLQQQQEAQLLLKKKEADQHHEAQLLLQKQNNVQLLLHQENQQQQEEHALLQNHNAQLILQKQHEAQQQHEANIQLQTQHEQLQFAYSTEHSNGHQQQLHPYFPVTQHYPVAKSANPYFAGLSGPSNVLYNSPVNAEQYVRYNKQLGEVPSQTQHLYTTVTSAPVISTEPQLPTYQEAKQQNSLPYHQIAQQQQSKFSDRVYYEPAAGTYNNSLLSPITQNGHHKEPLLLDNNVASTPTNVTPVARHYRRNDYINDSVSFTPNGRPASIANPSVLYEKQPIHVQGRPHSIALNNSSNYSFHQDIFSNRLLEPSSPPALQVSTVPPPSYQTITQQRIGQQDDVSENNLSIIRQERRHSLSRYEQVPTQEKRPRENRRRTCPVEPSVIDFLNSIPKKKTYPLMVNLISDKALMTSPSNTPRRSKTLSSGDDEKYHLLKYKSIGSMPANLNTMSSTTMRIHEDDLHNRARSWENSVRVPRQTSQ